MATIIEMLLSTMTDEEKATVRRKLAENPQILVDDANAGNLLSIYKAEGDSSATTTTTTAATTTSPAAHTPTVPNNSGTTTATATTASPASTAADPNAQILAKLTSMESTLAGQIADLKKNAVTVDKLPQYREELLTLAIKTNDEINQLRLRHKDELGENLDQARFEEFVNKSKTADGRPGYPTLTKAWEAMTLEARNKKAIDKGIEDGVKTRTSATTVPGQTQTTALSPAQAIMAKARATAQGEQKSNAVAAAERLAKIVRDRDGEGAGV